MADPWVNKVTAAGVCAWANIDRGAASTAPAATAPWVCFLPTPQDHRARRGSSGVPAALTLVTYDARLVEERSTDPLQAFVQGVPQRDVRFHGEPIA